MQSLKNAVIKSNKREKEWEGEKYKEKWDMSGNNLGLDYGN